MLGGYGEDARICTLLNRRAPFYGALSVYPCLDADAAGRVQCCHPRLLTSHIIAAARRLAEGTGKRSEPDLARPTLTRARRGWLQ